jgi:septum formation protein
VIHSNQEDLDEAIIVLGADTTVVGPGKVLGKPKDPQEAIEMLLLLRGIEHYVVTGFALLKPPIQTDLTVQTLHIEAITSRVVMKDCSLSEIERYIATGEPMDKAGAYALQGMGGNLIESVGGCRTNVIGLPLCAVRKALEAAGVEVLAYPQEGYCQTCLLPIDIEAR